MEQLSNQKIRAIVVDDEVMGRENLVTLLQKHSPEVEMVGQAENADIARTLIRSCKPDLVFLDIQMPGGTGFDLLQGFDKIDFKVIFVTAFDHFAVKAFRYHAIDYILKPINPKELKEAVDRVRDTGNALFMEQLEMLVDQKENIPERICLPVANGIEVCRIADIIRCEADNFYTTFHFVNGSTILATRHLGYYEGIIHDAGFVRVHKSHLVNLDHVKRYIRGDNGKVVMSDGSEVVVSRSRRSVVMERFSKFLSA